MYNQYKARPFSEQQITLFEDKIWIIIRSRISFSFGNLWEKECHYWKLKWRYQRKLEKYKLTSSLKRHSPMRANKRSDHIITTMECWFSLTNTRKVSLSLSFSFSHFPCLFSFFHFLSFLFLLLFISFSLSVFIFHFFSSLSFSLVHHTYTVSLIFQNQSRKHKSSLAYSLFFFSLLSLSFAHSLRKTEYLH